MTTSLSRRALAAALSLALATVVWRSTPRARAATPETDRVAAARARVEPGLRELCRGAELPYPPDGLFLRGFKSEAELEVWARATGKPYRLLLMLPIAARSGLPGPKRREGDEQVPEGFYVLDQFNPKSNFHLSMRVNYPNASDRILSDARKPGGQIYIHGNTVTIGCLPLGDANIERLYVLASDVSRGGQRTIPVHLFPARMSGEAWAGFLKENSEAAARHAEFWRSLQPGYDAFERERLVPSITVASDGRYRLAP